MKIIPKSRNQGAEKMAQWVKYLYSRRTGICVPYIHKIWNMVVHACNPTAGEWRQASQGPDGQPI